MKTNSKQFSTQETDGTSEATARHGEWIITVKLGLVAIAIFATVILLGMWR